MTASAADPLVYFGTYTRGDSASEGIYVSTLSDDGVLGEPTLAAEIDNPSFVALSPDGRFLYSVAEVADMADGGRKKSGGVAAFAIGDDGTLRRLNIRPTGGGGACHLSLTPDGRTVMVANYGGGSVASFPVGDDGSLGERASLIQHTGGSGVVAKRQAEPHAHSINPSPDGRFAFVCDLGLDQIKVYRLDGSKLVPTDLDIDTPPGGGPRHFAFHPDGTRAYANLELSHDLVAMDYDADSGQLTVTGVFPTRPDGYDGNGGTAECLVHPSGRAVYVTNRGHDSVAVFDVTGDMPKRLQIAEAGGPIPRGFGLSPDGRFAIVCHQNGDTVQGMAAADDGTLTPTGEPIAIGTPVNARVLSR